MIFKQIANNFHSRNSKYLLPQFAKYETNK